MLQNHPTPKLAGRHKPDISISISLNDIPRETASRRNSFVRSPSFKPLPAVPAGSPLRTSFIDTSFPRASPLSESHSIDTSSPPTIPSSLIPQASCTTELSTKTKSHPKTKPKIHDEPFLIPAFQHPNSPYVPWAPPVRRKILRPFIADSHISIESSNYSRPTSRSGARAPEPATPEPFSPTTMTGWGRIRQTLANGVSALKRPFASTSKPASPRSTHSSRTSHDNDDDDLTFEDNAFAANYSPESATPLAVLAGRRQLTLSMASLASSDSTTLAMWLAARRQASAEDQKYGAMMSMEDYERKGSWLNLSTGRSEEGEWVCRVPGCDIHAKHKALHGGIVTTLDFSKTTETFMLSRARSSQPFPPSSPKNSSSPHFTGNEGLIGYRSL